jgi:type VII secretion-associated serine protease mycosin
MGSRLTLVLLASIVLVHFPANVAFADDIRDRQWFLAFLDIEGANKYGSGKGVAVAVIDSGVDGSHQDLIGNVVQGIDCYQGGVGDGRDDLDGHGTAMAGLIAAHGHGGGGVAGALGVAPSATILPVNVGRYGLNDRTALAAGITWATDHGAKVISISSGGLDSGPEADAIRSALAANVVVVASAGNKPASNVQFPAAYPGVIAVSGIDQSGAFATSVSVSGPGVVLSAPAVDIVQPQPGNKYGSGTGTSDATAIVAGVAALVRSKYPNLSATEVVHRLTATATDKGPPGRDSQYGFGIVNPVAALTADVAPLPSPSMSATPTGTGDPTDIGGSDDSGQSTGYVIVVLGIGALAVVAVFAFLMLRDRKRSARP